MDIDCLSKMVKDLLLDNDRVALPGFGSFVAELAPSVFSDRGYTINPPYRKLSFRENAEADDMLLVRHYAAEAGMPEDKARDELIGFISGLREVLNRQKTVIFPELGRLRATRENNYFFVSDEDMDIFPDGVGLEPVSLKAHVAPAETASAVGPSEAPAMSADAPGPAPEDCMADDLTDSPADNADGSPAETDAVQPGSGKRKPSKVLKAGIAVAVVIAVAAIALVQGVRKVPVQYAKRIVGNKQYGGVRQYIPMKINAAGVMPIIFAQALMLFPLIFSQFDATRGLAATLSNYTGFWYNLIFGLLVVIFTYFYTAVTVNPTMMAEQLKQNGGFIPGVKPGKKTVEYLDSIMSRVTLPGSIFLALIAILPAFAMLLGVNNQFASFYGGTSLLILVGVVLDTLQQIESHLLMRHYDGLMKTGRLKGRSGM